MSTSFDVIVIGSGPGGYVTAIRASQLGLEDRHRRARQAWAASASTGAASRPRRCCARPRSIATSQHAKDFGLSIEGVKFDPEAVVKRSRGVAGRMEKGVQFLMKKNKIDVIEGDARLEKGSAAPKVIVKGKDGKEAPLRRQARHPRHRRACARNSGGGLEGRRQTHLDLSRCDDAARHGRNRCSCSARAPSASSSRASTPRSA